MGMFDTLNVTCPACGHRYDVQTKLGNNVLADISVGELTGISPHNRLFKFRLKHPCASDACRKYAVAVLAYGVLLGYELEELQEEKLLVEETGGVLSSVWHTHERLEVT